MMAHNLGREMQILAQPHGEWTLTLSANPTVKEDLLHFLDALQKAA